MKNTNYVHMYIHIRYTDRVSDKSNGGIPLSVIPTVNTRWEVNDCVIVVISATRLSSSVRCTRKRAQVMDPFVACNSSVSHYPLQIRVRVHQHELHSVQWAATCNTACANALILNR